MINARLSWNRLISAMCIAALLVLLLLAWVYWPERSLFMDMAFHAYHIVDGGDLAIQQARFGAVFSQSFPLIAVHLGFPLKIVLMAYSLSYYIIYLVLLLIILWVFRDRLAALTMVFVLLLLVADVFFWAQTELMQGLAFTPLFIAGWRNMKSGDHTNWWHLIWLVPWLFMLVYFHPLMIIVLGYAFGFYLLAFKKHQGWLTFLLAALAFIIYKSKAYLPLGLWYDDMKAETLDNFYAFWPDYLSIPSFGTLVHSLYTSYLPYTIVLMCVIIALSYFRKYFHLAWLLTFTVGYIFLINVTNPELGPVFYAEHMYLPIAFFVILPLVYLILPRFQPRVVVVGLALFCLVKFTQIILTAEKYTARLAWNTDMLNHLQAERGGNRFIVDEAFVPMDTLFLAWPVAYETLLISSLKGPDSAASIEIDPDPARFDYLHWHEDLFITYWDEYDSDDLPLQYFNMGRGRYDKVEGRP